MPVDRLHTLVAAGQFLAAYREVERLVLDPDLDQELRVKVLIVGVRAAAGLREIYSGAKMADKAIEAAELGTNWEDIGNARLYSALIYRELGDSAQALRFFHLFFQHLDRYPKIQLKTAHAYYNMALTLQQRREFPEALSSYQLASEDFERLGNLTGVLACSQNSAWVMLLQDRPDQAEAYVSGAATLSSQLEIPEYQVTQVILEAVYAKQTGQPNRAMSLCEEVFQPGRPGIQERHLATASWIMAGITLEVDRLHEASIFAELAVNHALQAKEPHLMNLASEIRKQVLNKKMSSVPNT